MNVTNIIKILSTVASIILGIAEIMKQVNLYNDKRVIEGAREN